MDIKSWALFTELGGLVVESRVFYKGNNTPQPTHLGGKRKSWDCFFKVLVILYFFAVNPHNLPNWTIFYTLQYFNLSRNICGKHWFWGKNDQFCIYPLSEHGWRAIKQMRAPFEPIITCISVNEESLGYDTMSYQHFLRIKYHFYENYFTVKSAKMLFY